MLKGAVIGCGRGGSLSLEALRRSRQYGLVAAADPAKGPRGSTHQSYPEISLFTDYRDMLAAHDPDVVCVATPAPTHEPIARDVSRHGVQGLLVEKPVACDCATADSLLRDLRAQLIPVVVPHGLLVLPAPNEIRKRICDGAIGQIQRIDIQNSVDLMNAGIHWLAFVLDLLAHDVPESVSASFDVSDHVINDGVQVESRGKTIISFASGVRVTLLSGRGTKPVSENLPEAEQRGALFRIEGSAGAIEFSAWAGSYWIAQTTNDASSLIRCGSAFDPSYHQLFLEQLADGIRGGKPDYRSADLSLGALRLIGEAYRTNDSADWQLGSPA